MKRHARIGWLMTGCMLFFTAVALADLRPKRYDIEDFPGVANQILITIDTTNLPVNIRLEDVHIQVGFYNENKQRVNGLDIPIGSLTGGTVTKFLRDYPAPPPSVMWIKGEQLSVLGDKYASGGKGDTFVATIESSSGFVSIRRPRGDAIAHAKLASPTQLPPADGTLFADRTFKPILEWSTVPGAASYGLEVDCFHCCKEGQWCSDVGGSTTVINEIHETRVTYAYANPQPYRWRVWSVGSDGTTSPKSPWATFSYR